MQGRKMKLPRTKHIGKTRSLPLAAGLYPSMDVEALYVLNEGRRSNLRTSLPATFGPHAKGEGFTLLLAASSQGDSVGQWGPCHEGSNHGTGGQDVLMEGERSRR